MNVTLAAAAASQSNAAVKTIASDCTVEVRYPSFEFRETLRTLRPSTGNGGIWIVIDLGNAATIEECKAACTVLRHYYPGEAFVVRTIPAMLAS